MWCTIVVWILRKKIIKYMSIGCSMNWMSIISISTFGHAKDNFRNIINFSVYQDNGGDISFRHDNKFKPSKKKESIINDYCRQINRLIK